MGLPMSNPPQKKPHRDYWRANLSLLAKLLSIWFMVSFGCSILWIDWLDQFSFYGFKLGFWFAHQGAILVFVVLIFVYAWRMKALDRQFDVADSDQHPEKIS
jgi:putative solute:sodium symporter small subunit